MTEELSIEEAWKAMRESVGLHNNSPEDGYWVYCKACDMRARALVLAVLDEIIGTDCRCGVSRVMTLTCRRCRYRARVAALGQSKE